MPQVEDKPSILLKTLYTSKALIANKSVGTAIKITFVQVYLRLTLRIHRNVAISTSIYLYIAEKRYRSFRVIYYCYL